MLLLMLAVYWLLSPGTEAANPAPLGGDFRAYYTHLDVGDMTLDDEGNPLGPITGQYTDVIIRFSNQRQLEFSRATSYLPVWKSEQGQWPFQALVSRTGDGSADRPDRINRYSYVRIIQSDANQALIHWRYVRDFANPTPLRRLRFAP